MTTALSDYLAAVPLNVIAAAGFAALDELPDLRLDAEDVAALRDDPAHLYDASQSIGLTGARLLVLITAFDGVISADDLAAQTRRADPAAIAAAVDRLCAAGFASLDADGRVSLRPVVRARFVNPMPSLGDPHSIATESLAVICQTIGIPIPLQKDLRVDAIRAAFADASMRAAILRDVSPTAMALLDHIIDEAGLGPIEGDAVGLEPWHLMEGAIDRRGLRSEMRHNQGAQTLRELTSRGIIGVDTRYRVWVWREAWTLLDRPFIAEWSVAERPALVGANDDPGTTVPHIVGLADRALAYWSDHAPVVLKSGELRVGRQDLRATARAAHSDEATVDLFARLAIEIGVLAPAVVKRRGRGRNQRVDEVWAVTEPLATAWRGLEPMHKWARLAAEWTRPSNPIELSILGNRQLVLWELQQLAPGTAYGDDAGFVAWGADHYAPTAERELLQTSITELRALAMITRDALALTGLGRALLADPRAAAETRGTTSTSAFVQADLTVVAPPDLRHDLSAALQRIAKADPGDGAMIYRLDATRITHAVQAGESADSIVATLRNLAGRELPDTVTRLVADAAARAGVVQVVSAATVLVVDDPVDLTTACAIKSLALVRLSDTVAATEVAVGKVCTALEAKGIVPKVVAVTKAVPTAAPDAARVGDAADDAVAARVEQAVTGRLALPHAVMLTPAAARALDAEAQRDG